MGGGLPNYGGEEGVARQRNCRERWLLFLRVLAAGVGAGLLGVEHGAVTLVVLQEGIGGDALQVVLGDEVFYYIGELRLATGLFVLEHEAVELEVEETSKLCLDEVG